MNEQITMLHPDQYDRLVESVQATGLYCGKCKSGFIKPITEEAKLILGDKLFCKCGKQPPSQTEERI